jgi:hypothetical protein
LPITLSKTTIQPLHERIPDGGAPKPDPLELLEVIPTGRATQRVDLSFTGKPPAN